MKREIIIIIFGIITFLLLAILFFVNRLYLKKEDVDNLFKNVVEYVKDRKEIIERAFSYIEINAPEEIKLIKELQTSFDELDKIATTSPETLKTIKKSFKLNKKVEKLGEIHPKLQKEDIFKNIKYDLNLNEERTLYSIEAYDKEAKKYNEFKQKKIYNKLSKILKLKDYEYYEE